MLCEAELPLRSDYSFRKIKHESCSAFERLEIDSSNSEEITTRDHQQKVKRDELD